jgi:L-ornithine Nalpha-acyltransferase
MTITLLKKEPVELQENVLENIAAGGLRVVIASSRKEIENAKKLRFDVFFKEMGAIADNKVMSSGLDHDEFDDYCDHLLVLDEKIKDNNPVVGTYRLLRGRPARNIGRFYSEAEFDISKIKQTSGEILELGRSCVHSSYRNRATMQLLWRGIAAYIKKYDVSVLFGCASMPGIEVEKYKNHLSYLYHNHLAPENVCSQALPNKFINMNIVPKSEIDNFRTIASLPPLVKGYLRLGGFVGDGAVIDHQHNTIDVCIIVQPEAVSARYANRYVVEDLKK